MAYLSKTVLVIAQQAEMLQAEMLQAHTNEERFCLKYDSIISVLLRKNIVREIMKLEIRRAIK